MSTIATQPSGIESFKAAADLSAHQWKGVKLTAKDTVNVVSAAADRAIGVLMNKPTAAGQHAQVLMFGQRMKAVSDGSGTAIAVGDYVGFNASGKLVKKATADYSVIGIANDASSADGVIIEFFCIPINWFRTAAG
jgi:hypothetical protein